MRKTPEIFYYYEVEFEHYFLTAHLRLTLLLTLLEQGDGCSGTWLLSPSPLVRYIVPPAYFWWRYQEDCSAADTACTPAERREIDALSTREGNTWKKTIAEVRLRYHYGRSKYLQQYRKGENRTSYIICSKEMFFCRRNFILSSNLWIHTSNHLLISYTIYTVTSPFKESSLWCKSFLIDGFP